MRKPIGKKLRFEIFKRDEFTCQYCGEHPPAVTLEIDHVHPVALGGDNDPDNLLTACKGCNAGKSANPLSNVIPTYKQKASDLREREEQLSAYQELLQQKDARLESQMWKVADMLFPGRTEVGYLKTYLASMRTFLENLGFQQVLEAAWMTDHRLCYSSDKKKFLYFCKVCWNKVNGVEF